MLADKVVFMDSGGYLAWYGPPKEAMAYFGQYQRQKEKLKQFDDIYTILDDPELGNPKDWADRFQASAAYRKYIAEPLQFRQEQDIQPIANIWKPLFTMWKIICMTLRMVSTLE